MRTILRCLLTVQLFFGACLHGFIYKVNILRKWDIEKNRYKYFFGFSDFHNKSHKINSIQVDVIEKLLKKCPKNSTQVIVEDISSNGFEGRSSCGLFFVDAQGGVLSDITKKCKKNNLADLCNLEYRYCRVTAMAPVLNNVKSDFTKFDSVTGIKVQAIINEIEQVLHKLNTYKDGKILSGLYKKYSKIIRSDIKSFNLYSYSNLSIADFLKQETTENNRLSFVKNFLIFDSILLDLKILHEVQKSSSDHYNIITLAGGAHIKSVKKFLKKLGYEEIYQKKADFIKEMNLEKCLGGTIIDGSYCLKPNPVDLLEVESFL